MLQYILLIIILIFLLTDNKYLTTLQKYNRETEILFYKFILIFIKLIPRIIITIIQLITIIYLILYLILNINNL
jgi:hypothetical protein